MRLAVSSALAWLGLFAGSAAAHFHMLLPQTATAKKGEIVVFTYQWGHPFEHQLFDAPQPLSLTVRAPMARKADLTDHLQKAKRQSGSKEVVVYQLRFHPDQRGDYGFVLQTPPIWMEEDGEYLQDTVKVVLHVQAQKGWDAAERKDFDFMPLTRPYGLRPGMVFQAQLQGQEKERGGVSDSLVEIEHYNPRPPAKLPPDEHITPHGQDRPQRHRDDDTDGGGLVVPDCRPSGRSADARRQELSGAAALHLVGLRGRTGAERVSRGTTWVRCRFPCRCPGRCTSPTGC